MGNELDEFIDMYYWPCITALFDTNVNYSSVVEKNTSYHTDGQLMNPTRKSPAWLIICTRIETVLVVLKV